MRAMLSCLIFAMVCCGFAQATDGIYLRGSQGNGDASLAQTSSGVPLHGLHGCDEAICFSPLGDQRDNSWNSSRNGRIPWLADRWSDQTADRANSTTSTAKSRSISPAKAETRVANTASDASARRMIAAGPLFSSLPTYAAPMAITSLVGTAISALFVGQWVRARRNLRSQRGTPAILTASLGQPRVGRDGPGEINSQRRIEQIRRAA